MRRFMNILLALAVLVACERRPLEEIEYKTRIDVKVNIEAIANVTCDVYNEKIQIPEIAPVTMHALFFDQDTEKIASEAFLSDVETDADGTRSIHGSISLLPGNYKMLMYDFGTKATIVKDYYNWQGCNAYTEEVSPIIKKSFASKADIEEAYVVYEPDHLVVATSENEYIPYHEDIHTISVDATSVVESYYLQIKVQGLEYVASAQAVLSGMVSSNIISSNTRVVEPEATLWFNLEKSDDKGVPVICTVFNTFGRIDKSLNKLEVTFDIKTHDGHVVQEVFDISDLFSTKECTEHHWLLLDEEIVVPPPLSSGGGFAPEVNDWEEERSEIIL
jgi:hypothetical protein